MSNELIAKETIAEATLYFWRTMPHAERTQKIEKMYELLHTTNTPTAHITTQKILHIPFNTSTNQTIKNLLPKINHGSVAIITDSPKDTDWSLIENTMTQAALPEGVIQWTTK